MSFSFSVKKASNTAKAVTVAAKARPATATLAAFKEALEAEEERQKEEAAKPTLETFARKTERKEKEKINELLKENPKALAYDEVYDEVSSGTAKEEQRKAQARRLYLGYTEDIRDKIAKDGMTADALAAHAASAAGGLMGPPGTPGGAQGTGGTISQARFIGKLLVQAQRRQIEREIIQERQIQKEREKEGGTADEAFVTSAYRARLEERQRIQQELELQEARDAARAADKQKDLSSFHAYLLKSGAATRSAAVAPAPSAFGAAAAASAAVKAQSTPSAAVKAEVPAASTETPSLHQQKQHKEEEAKEERADSSSTSNSSSSSSSSSIPQPITKDMVLPFKRLTEPKTVPVPDRLSSKDLASARARYLQRKKLKTEE